MHVERVAMLGEKDHGKSTLIGTLLIQTGSVSESRIEEAKAISRKLKRKFEPGFLLDSFSEERSEGKTIDTTRAQITYKGKAYEFIDVPGHAELINNMLSGASYGDVALLIVSAKEGERVKTQTKRHLLLANMLGIRNVIVAVNKMDLVRYSKAAFDSIKNELENFVSSVDFAKLNMNFVPISAYRAENVIKRSAAMGWYNGATLIDALSRARLPKPKVEKLRVVAQGVMEDSGLIAVNVISGAVNEGETLVAYPEGFAFKVTKIVDRGRKVKIAKAGDKAYIGTDRKIPSNLRGSVLCKKGDAPLTSTKISSLVFATGNMSGRLSLGFNGREVACKKISVHKVFDVKMGKGVTSKGVNPLSFAYADIVLAEELAYERYSDVRQLGRFTLRSGGNFVGIGIVR